MGLVHRAGHQEGEARPEEHRPEGDVDRALELLSGLDTAFEITGRGSSEARMNREKEYAPFLSPEQLEGVLLELEIEMPRCRTVLLVDDEPENLEVLAELLQEWDVHLASSGEQALDTVARLGTVDLIITDQRMPGIRGIDLLSRIAEQDEKTVRVVLTGYSDVEPILDAVNRGKVHRFLFKPFDAEEIRLLVEDGMRLKAARMAMEHLVSALGDRQRHLERRSLELKEARQELLEVDRLATIGKFTAGVVHELRNAAQCLSFLMDLVQLNGDLPQLLDACGRAKTSLEAFIEQLEHIRGYLRAEMTEARREPTNVQQFLLQTVDLFNREAVSKKLEVRVRLEQDRPVANIDHCLLQQGLLALLRNAARANPMAHHTISSRGLVELAFEAVTDRTTRLVVSDRGKGMDARTLARATEPLFSSFSPAGLGLGLEIARLAAEAHGGRLGLHSSPGRGTTASLWLDSQGERVAQ